MSYDPLHKRPDANPNQINKGGDRVNRVRIVLHDDDDEEEYDEDEDDSRARVHRAMVIKSARALLAEKKKAAGISKSPKKVALKDMSFEDYVQKAHKDGLVKARALPDWMQPFDINAHHGDAFYPILVDLGSYTLRDDQKKVWLESVEAKKDGSNPHWAVATTLKPDLGPMPGTADAFDIAATRLSFLTSAVMDGLKISPITRDEAVYLLEEFALQFYKEIRFLRDDYALEERRAAEFLAAHIQHVAGMSMSGINSFAADMGYSTHSTESFGIRGAEAPPASVFMSLTGQIELNVFSRLNRSYREVTELIGRTTLYADPFVANFGNLLAYEDVTIGPRYSPEWETRELPAKASCVIVWVPREQFITPDDSEHPANPMLGALPLLKTGKVAGVFVPRNPEEGVSMDRSMCGERITRLMMESSRNTRVNGLDKEQQVVRHDLSWAMPPEMADLLNEVQEEDPVLVVDSGMFDAVIQGFCGAALCGAASYPQARFPKKVMASFLKQNPDYILPFVEPDGNDADEKVRLVSAWGRLTKPTKNDEDAIRDELAVLAMFRRDPVPDAVPGLMKTWLTDKGFPFRHQVIWLDRHHRVNRVDALEQALKGCDYSLPALLAQVVGNISGNAGLEFLVAFTGGVAGVQNFDHLIRQYISDNHNVKSVTELLAPMIVDCLLLPDSETKMADRFFILLEAIRGLMRDQSFDGDLDFSPVKTLDGDEYINTLNPLKVGIAAKPSRSTSEDDDEEESSSDDDDDDEEDTVPLWVRDLSGPGMSPNQVFGDAESAKAVKDLREIFTVLAARDATRSMISGPHLAIAQEVGMDNLSIVYHARGYANRVSDLVERELSIYRPIVLLKADALSQLKAASEPRQSAFLEKRKHSFKVSDELSRVVNECEELVNEINEAKRNLRWKLDQYSKKVERVRQGFYMSSRTVESMSTIESIMKDLREFPFIQELTRSEKSVHLVMKPSIITLDSARAYWDSAHNSEKDDPDYFNSRLSEHIVYAISRNIGSQSALSKFKKAAIEHPQFAQLCERYGKKAPEVKYTGSGVDDEFQRFLSLSLRESTFQRYVPSMCVTLTDPGVTSYSDATDPWRVTCFAIGAGLREMEEPDYSDMGLAPDLVAELTKLRAEADKYQECYDKREPERTHLSRFLEGIKDFQKTEHGFVVPRTLDRDVTLLRSAPTTPHLKLDGSSCWSGFSSSIRHELVQKRYLRAVMLMYDFFNSATDSVTGMPGLIKMPSRETKLKFISRTYAP
jgi:hypothetical protein